ncbi:hypothetical protein GCM10022222_28270 [Amycolatopsis ultiminotia]|uniref:Uncharacterized protein n=1 Tax=Amycolatopsis ultiminotia TaxID=543629 RepID=A0ABP6W0Y0_9PSEU
MSENRWFDAWVPWPELSGLAAAGRALLPPVPATPATLVRMVTEQLVGRRLTTTVEGHEAGLTLTELDYPADSLRLATGRVGDVRIVAEDVDWPERPSGTDPAEHPPVSRIPLRRVTVLARDVRVRGLPSPTFVPTAVELHIAVSGDVVGQRVARTRPALLATPHPDGFRVRWRKRPHWGHLAFVAGVEDCGVVLTPTTVHIGRWKTRLPHRIRPIVLPLPDLPKGLRLTGVQPGEDELVLTTAADEWPGHLARIPLPDILTWLTTAAMTLTLPGIRPRS